MEEKLKKIEEIAKHYYEMEAVGPQSVLLQERFKGMRELAHTILKVINNEIK